MIELHDLSFSYPGHEPILHGLNLTFAAGSHVALSGPNGAGKSTLALLVKGLLGPDSGELLVDGMAAVDEKTRDMIMRRVGLVFQNPENTFVATTVERELAFGLENLGVDPAEMRARVDESLERFDLARYRFKNPSQLSGGEKQRLALAAVMIMRPSHLILDEPTSLLDPWVRSHIIDLIHHAAAEGATVLHITPFAGEAAQADRLVVLGGEGVIADAAPSELIGGGRNDSFSFVGETVCAADRNGDGPMNRISGSHEADREKRTLLSLENIHFSYGDAGGKKSSALTDVSLTLKIGMATALLGRSGSGKTTLLEIAAGLSKPSRGTVSGNGAENCAMAFQFPEDQIFGDTVEEYVAFGLKNRGRSESETSGAVERALLSLGFQAHEILKADPLALSGGEQRRVALAAVLAIGPAMLVLDEPTAGLDREGVDRIAAVLKNYVDGGGALLFSTHDFALAECLADNAMLLENGRISSQGDTETVLSGISIT